MLSNYWERTKQLEIEMTELNQIGIRKETDELGIKMYQLKPKYPFEMEWNIIFFFFTKNTNLKSSEIILSVPD